MTFTFDDVPDMTGKTVLVTGATSGLGLNAAMMFARKGARVLVHGRSAESAETAAATIRGRSEGATVEAVHADFVSLRSVKKLASSLAKTAPVLDIVVLNAGTAGIAFDLSDDDVETVMAVNYLAHFYLVKRLEPILKHSKTRIVSVCCNITPPSSGFPMSLDLWNDEPNYNTLWTYGASKQALLLFTKGIAQRYAQDGIVATAVDPGIASTGLQAKATGSGLFPFFLRNFAWLFTSSAESASIGIVRAAVSEAVTNGSTWYLLEQPWDVSTHVQSELIDQLWDLTLEILDKKGLKLAPAQVTK
eukprot:jgi/Hompol1/2413/HPOL_006009-RA